MTDTQDYGEPWEMDGTDIADNAGKMVCESFLCDRDQIRAIACVNACAGIANPEEVVPLMVAAVKRIKEWDDSGRGSGHAVVAHMAVDAAIAALSPKREGSE